MAKQKIKIGVTRCSWFFCLTACNLEAATLSALGGAPPFSTVLLLCPREGDFMLLGCPFVYTRMEIHKKSLFPLPFLFQLSGEASFPSPTPNSIRFHNLERGIGGCEKNQLGQIPNQTKQKPLKINSVQPQNRNTSHVSSYNFYLWKGRQISKNTFKRLSIIHDLLAQFSHTREIIMVCPVCYVKMPYRI